MMKDKKSGSEKKKSVGVMNVVLLFVAASLIVFTVVMIYTFQTYGAIPDTLCTCVFVALGGECGAMAWIKTTKERYRERDWELEDREHSEEQNNTSDEKQSHTEV